MRVEFERGVPVALDGERLGLVELLERAGEIGARHGVGIVDHIEDRIVGLKVRDLYEVPAAAIILTAHKELEKLVGTIHQNTFKPQLDDHWAYLVYAGLWYEPLLSDLNAFMDAVNEQVTGEVTMRLYKGSARPVARRSPNALYDPALAGFGESGGLFSQQASPGFIELWSLQSRMAYNVRNRGKGSLMKIKGYTVLGWLTWQGIKTVAKRKMSQNKVKLGAAATVAAGAGRRPGRREGRQRRLADLPRPARSTLRRREGLHRRRVREARAVHGPARAGPGLRRGRRVPRAERRQARRVRGRITVVPGRDGRP